MVTSTRKRYHQVVEEYDEAHFGLGYIGFLLRRFFVTILLVIFLILLVVKLDKAGSFSWWVNSIPLYVAILWKLVTKIADDNNSIKNTEDDEERASKSMVMRAMTVCLIIAFALLLVFIILSVVRLDGASFSVAIVFIPVFLVMGCFLFCCCICGPCFCCSQQGMPESDFEANPNGSDAPWWEIKRQRYLEGSPSNQPNENSPLTEID